MPVVKERHEDKIANRDAEIDPSAVKAALAKAKARGFHWMSERLPTDNYTGNVSDDVIRQRRED